MPRVWRVRMRSGAEGVDHRAARAFAIRDGWVGAGWGLDSPCPIPEGCPDYQLYLRHALQFHTDDRSVAGIAQIMGEEMRVGDYCWMYATHTGEYYCCVVTGGFEYRHEGAFDEYDLHILRRCRWALAGTADAVPGVVRRALAGQFGAINSIVTNADAAVTAARIALGELVPEAGGDFFALVGPEDLEDVVALFLQQRGWRIMPSTAKSSMASYEFVMVHCNDGRRAGVQVKSGGVAHLHQDVAQEFDEFFVFLSNPLGQVEGDEARIQLISREDIETFARQNWTLLPRRLQRRWPVA